MKLRNAFILSLTFLGLYSANAEDLTRNNLLSVFGQHSSIDLAMNTENVYGLYYNTESAKLELVAGSHLTGFYGNVKFDPLHDRKWFVKPGISYTNQDFGLIQFTSREASLATGYMFRDDFYLEIGGKYGDLDSGLRDTYTTMSTHAVKRFDSSFGTTDISISVSKMNYDLYTDKTTYTGNIHYYPIDKARFSYTYSYSDQLITNMFLAEYSFVFAAYQKDITHDRSLSTIGLQCAFSNLTDFSTYTIPTSIKRHISE